MTGGWCSENASGFRLNLNVQSAASGRDTLEKGKRIDLYFEAEQTLQLFADSHLVEQGCCRGALANAGTVRGADVMLSEVVVITGQAFYDALTFIKPSLESASGFKLNLNVQSAASGRDALEKGEGINLYLEAKRTLQLLADPHLVDRPSLTNLEARTGGRQRGAGWPPAIRVMLRCAMLCRIMTKTTALDNGNNGRMTESMIISMCCGREQEWCHL